MRIFRDLLRTKIYTHLYYKMGAANHDEARFGVYQPASKPLLAKIKTTIKQITGYKKNIITESYLSGVNQYEERLNRIFEHLNEKDQNLLVDLVAYRFLGAERIKLPRHNRQYHDAMQVARNLQSGTETYNPNFRHFSLQKFDLNPIGLDLKLFLLAQGVAIGFILEQYAYKNNNEYIVNAEEGESVIDAGGCWGDTALYFADKVGPAGKVYSFEFIPNNIKLFNINLQLNPTHQKRIELVKNPVARTSGIEMYYKDDGPASRVELSPFTEQTGSTTTLSIDDFVAKNAIQRVDFIKMDIEGAEPDALIGSIETIKKFKPKLAIAIYHSMNDFTGIPNWILNLNLGYEIYLDHFTIHGEETIIFAKAKNV